MDLDELNQSGFALFVLFVYHGSSISASLSQPLIRKQQPKTKLKTFYTIPTYLNPLYRGAAALSNTPPHRTQQMKLLERGVKGTNKYKGY